MTTIDYNIPPPHHGRWVRIAEKMKLGASILLKTVEQASCLTCAIRRLGFVPARERQADGSYRVWKLEAE